MNLQQYTLAVQELVHDLRFVDFTQSEMTNYVNLGRFQVAMDTHCVRAPITTGNVVTGIETYPITGGIAGLQIVSPGSHYTAPTAQIASPFTGSLPGQTATATLSLTNGAITAASITNWGQQYDLQYSQVPPVVTINDATGSGAQIIPIVMANVIDFAGITILWGTLRQSLLYRPFRTFNAFFRANLNFMGTPAVYSMIQEANLFYLQPIPDQPYTIEFDAVMLPIALANLTDVDAQIPVWYSDAVAFYAAHRALMKLQNFGQADAMMNLYMKRVMNAAANKQTARVLDIYRNAYRRVRRM